MSQSEQKELAVKPRKRHMGKACGSPCCTPTVQPSLQTEEASVIANMLRALSDPTRLQIVSLLADHPGEVCVCDITGNFDLDQSTISHHLRLLREAGVADCVRHGVWVYYFLRAGALQSISKFLKQLEHSVQPEPGG